MTALLTFERCVRAPMSRQPHLIGGDLLDSDRPTGHEFTSGSRHMCATTPHNTTLTKSSTPTILFTGEHRLR
jgi:hypothetical protein